MICFDRILGILLHLRGGRPVAAGALAEQFGVSRRTIYRDMDTLSALGVPVYAERGLAGGFRLLPGYFLPPLMFSRGEAVSLVLGLALWRSLRGRPLMTELETAERKLLAALPDELRQLLANSAALVGFEPQPPDLLHPEPENGTASASIAGAPAAGGYETADMTPSVPSTGAPAAGEYETVDRKLPVSGSALPGAREPGPAALAESETLEPDAVSRTGGTFLQAILDGRQVSMQYRSPYREQQQRITASPLAMFWDRDRWYLVGRKPATDGTAIHRSHSPEHAGQAEGRTARIQVWRADRVLDIQLHGEPHAQRQVFDVRRLLGRRWLAPAMEEWRRESPVTIRVSSEQAALLQKDWYYRHARFEADEAGGTRMTYGADKCAEVFALLRWLGPGAELVEPRAWRQQLAAELKQMLAAHTDS